MSRLDEIKSRCDAGRPIPRIDVKWMLEEIDQLTARAGKVEVELSELRAQRLEIPQTAIAIRMDTPVQIGHVRFGPGCTIWKCPFCGRFLTPIHKFCSNCGQAVSFHAPEKEE